MKDQMRILVSQQEGQYVGQMLEYDIVAQAPTLESLMHRINITLRVESEHCETLGKTLDDCVPSAPQNVVDLWDAASVTLSAGEDVPFDLKAA